MTHDKLQSKCFIWFWNTYPELRYLMHANINSHSKWEIKEIVKLKSIGLVKGVLDLEFYYKGVLHVFDIKIGKDKLSKHQKEFILAVESQGGSSYEIRSFDDFKDIIGGIV